MTSEFLCAILFPENCMKKKIIVSSLAPRQCIKYDCTVLFYLYIVRLFMTTIVSGRSELSDLIEIA